MQNAPTFSCAAIACVIVLVTTCIDSFAQDAATPQAPVVPANLDVAVNGGLTFLESQQGTDGAFEASGTRIATTGLGVLAFLGAGHTPDPNVGRFGLTVRNAVDFIVSQAPEDGYFGKIDGSRMYGQGIITLALAEAYGVEELPEQRKRIHLILDRAVKVILKAQAVPKPEAQAGGWRYEPDAADSDISLSGWNALALRAAASVGIDVPKSAIEKATAFILKCYIKDGKGFSYQPGGAVGSGPAGVAALSLHLLGSGDRPEVAEAMAYLVQHPTDERFPYYSQYYTVQAANQAGDEKWKQLAMPILERLISQKQPDGGWPASTGGQEPGRVYATALALMSLDVPYRLLPAYQR